MYVCNSHLQVLRHAFMIGTVEMHVTAGAGETTSLKYATKWFKFASLGCIPKMKILLFSGGRKNSQSLIAGMGGVLVVREKQAIDIVGNLQGYLRALRKLLH